MTLGTAIQRLRKERGWTQGKLAQHSEVSQSHISKIERNESEDVSLRIVAQLASTLETSTDYLCEEAGWLPARSQTKELTLVEQVLIDTIRHIVTPAVRQKALQHLLWIVDAVVAAERSNEGFTLKKAAEAARDADLARQEPALRLAAEAREEYEEERK